MNPPFSQAHSESLERLATSLGETFDQHLSRRAALKTALTVAGAAALMPSALSAAEDKQLDARRASPKHYDMKKSINLWAFPYPDRMALRECLQLAKDSGFDGIELNFDL